ncbi:The BTB (BR-C, ttk and bab)/POZ (Pox virus and Zinc finger) domain [Ceratobasidium sp. AG-Ba]|nr:The BTB (BR-C, ttk and bab)/POZ (Pox virus and Zinc finger) domain [Ceratobasidium sp. AG-Ba]
MSTPKSKPPRDTKYYFEDGSVVFLVAKLSLCILFARTKIQRSLLTSHSTVFEDMFQLPKQENIRTSISGAKEGTTDENPIAIPQVTAIQFRHLLLFFYGNIIDPEYRALVLDATDLPSHSPEIFKGFLDIASLANRFCMETVETWALGQFKRVMQSCARITPLFTSHADLLDALSYTKLTPDRDLEHDVRNMTQCYTHTLKSTTNSASSNGLVLLYRDPLLKKSEGYKSQLWQALTRDERAKLFAAQAYLTPLPSSLPINWIQNTYEISNGVGAQRPPCFRTCSNNFISRASQLFARQEVLQDSPLAGVNAVARLPTQRQQLLAQNIDQGGICSCNRQLLTAVDDKIDALFTDLATSYHDRLD